jgi:hypothetical protein
MGDTADCLYEPALVDNLKAQENMADAQLIILPESNKKRGRSPQTPNSDDKGNSKAKRQLFSGTMEGCSEPLPMSSSPIVVNSEVSIPVLSTKHQDDDEHDTSTNYCLVGATGLPQPFPFIAPVHPLANIAGPSGDYSQPVYDMTKNFTPDVDSDEFNSYINGSFVPFLFMHHPFFIILLSVALYYLLFI